MDTCFIWMNKLMKTLNNCFPTGCEGRGHDVGHLLCKITVQFSLMLYMCSHMEWDVCLQWVSVF